MTKRQLTFAFLIALLAYFWWHDSDNESSHQTRTLRSPIDEPKLMHQEIPKNQPPTMTPANRAAIKDNKTARPLQPKEKQRNLKTTMAQKSPDAVPFKNYKGMAIAYGDVLLGKLEENVSEGYTSPPEVNYWPSATIPYHIQPNVPNTDRILKALSYLSEKTVLEFVPYEEGMPDAIVFEPTTDNCLSYVGRISGTQPIFISSGCDWFHIVHEVLHAMGLVHEHSRPDRDQFISVLWENIPLSYRSQFEIMPESFMKDWLRYDYDTQSIMHYGSQVFIANSKGTSLIRKDGATIPEPQGLSPIDIQKVNDLFQGR